MSWVRQSIHAGRHLDLVRKPDFRWHHKQVRELADRKDSRTQFRLKDISANCLGWYAEYRYELGVDLIAELEALCDSVAKEFPRTVFFSGRLVFERENFFTRLLHNHTPFTLQQRLQFAGRDMMILPIRVFANA